MVASESEFLKNKVADAQRKYVHKSVFHRKHEKRKNILPTKVISDMTDIMDICLI